MSTTREDHGQAVAVVEDFLASIGAGRLDEASRHLAPGALIVFPGGAVHGSLDAMAASGATRYRSVDKVREHYDAADGPDGAVVVVSTGTLFGVNLHGVPFAGVRYVDRFVLRDGLVQEQHVWNDLTLSGVLLAQEPSAVPEQWRAPPAAPAATVRRSATARWQGDLRAGGGELDLDSGAAPTMPFSLRARRDGSSAATSAEELLAAAHASCFAMALRGALDRAHDHGEDGSDDGTVEVRATCTLRIDASGWTIDAVALEVSAPGVRSARLAAAVASAERTCAVSQLVQDRALVTVTVAAAAGD